MISQTLSNFKMPSYLIWIKKYILLLQMMAEKEGKGNSFL